MTDQERIKALADALNDIITMGQRVQIKGELRRGKLVPIEAINMANEAARAALDATGIRVRRTGRV